jgi:hypothetical protein
MDGSSGQQRQVINPQQSNNTTNNNLGDMTGTQSHVCAALPDDVSNCGRTQ